MARVKVGDTYLFRGKVTRVSDDRREITLKLPAYDYPITVAAADLERHDGDDIINEQALSRRR